MSDAGQVNAPQSHPKQPATPQGQTWIIADPHLGQEGMEWDGRDPDHSELTVVHLHAALRPGDLLVMLGDLSCAALSPEEQLRWIRQAVPPGVRALATRGNHDLLDDAEYASAGVTMLDSVVLDGALLSHFGSRSLPDNARFQVIGHYHQMPANPELPHVWQLSHALSRLRPVKLESVRQHASQSGVLRPLPVPVDDRHWIRDHATYN